MNARRRVWAAALAAVLAVALGAAAAWPVYATPRLVLVAGAAAAIGVVTGTVCGLRRRGWITATALLVGLFAVTVVPVTMPSRIGVDAFGPALAEALAAVALGWKQLLTLSLPVGDYRAVLVPAYAAFAASAMVAVRAAASRRAPLAAIPLLAPVAFGTVFGASATSAPLRLGPLTVVAPRELALWLAAAALAGVWVAWTATARRRAALRRGREQTGRGAAPGAAMRFGSAALMLAAALVAGLALTPALDRGERQALRDRVDPAIVLQSETSPLAGYRAWKRDDAIDRPLFSVRVEGRAPERLRLAVLDRYDGVDFHVGDDAAGRFARFPSGEPGAVTTTIEVRALEGSAGPWLPAARFARPPQFTGDRADALADALYVNRAAEAAIVAAEGGFVEGDGYRAELALREAAGAIPDRGSREPLSLAGMPELESWIDAQNGAGFGELVALLRERGFLSHSMTVEPGERVWHERLAETYGTRFEPSVGGHSAARIETMFAQLNAQQRLAGASAGEALVAAVGDDEQFAAAAALIARTLGLESRVVVGVRLAAGAGAAAGGAGTGAAAEVDGVPACAEVCTGEHLAAWAEVRGDAGDWVAVDATPQVVVPPSAQTDGEQLPEYPTVPEERSARPVDPPIGLGEQDEAAPQTDPPAEPSQLPLLLKRAAIGLAALLLLALPLLFIPVAKRLRARRRRRERHPELRVLGAWNELVDRARDCGIPVTPSMPRSDAAAVIGNAVAARAAREADRAVFSPAGASSDDADRLWRAVDDDWAERRASEGLCWRVGRAYSLRSVLARLGPPRRRAETQTQQKRRGER